MSGEPVVQSARSGPIFIVGAMGSGTTLIRLILDSHDNIAIAQETGFMRAILANKWIPFWKFGGEWYGRLGWSEEELDVELAAFYNRLFQRFAEQQGKQRWGDKTPYHMWHMPQASRVFPDAVFVAIVRHPGAVASSLHDRFKYDWPKSVGHWVRSNLELLHRAPDLGDRLAVLRYEDLVLDPEPVLRELVEWLGEPWTPRVLEHHVVHTQRGTPAKVEGHTRSDEPIDVSRISKWQSAIDAEGRRVLAREAEQLAQLFGYDVNDAQTVQPLIPTTPDRSHLLTGDDLAQRQATLRMHDFGPWPRPSMANQMLQPRKYEVVAKKKANAKKANAKKSGGARPTPATDGVDSHARRAVKAAVARLTEPARGQIKKLAKVAPSRR